MNKQITSPEAFFGFQLGTDRKMARWNKIVDYFRLLGEQSDKIQVIDMGPSTEGHPFLFVVISSPENLANLAHLRAVNAQIKDPRGISEDVINSFVEEGKAIILQSMGLHATEIGSTQMVSELAYDQITRADEEATRILDNVISLMVPCFNPDGQIMVTDWYNKYVGTEYEGSTPPWLYHKYAGHDNNRDAFMFNLVESQYMAQLMYKEWQPHAYQDHHEMGCYGARLWICPYSEPLHPHGDPLVWREISWYGAHMAYKLEEAGKTGVLNASLFPAWSHLGFHWMGNYHNIASMLTESAHAKLATPMYIHRSQLKGEDDRKQLSGEGSNTLRAFPDYKPQTNFPHPWEGGWWRVRDIVEQQKISAWGLLDMAARNKDTILRNAYLKAKRQTALGASSTPAAYLIRPDQHDPLTVVLAINKLLVQGIDIQKSTQAFTVDGSNYPSGTYCIPLNQPKMGVIKTLLGRTLYPDDAWTRQPDGTPQRPYDSATDTMAEFMGVDVVPVQGSIEGTFESVTEPEPITGGVIGSSQIGYLFNGRLNDSFKVLNRLFDQGVEVARLHDKVVVGDEKFRAGAFVAAAGTEDLLTEIAQECGVTFHALEGALEIKKGEVRRARIGMYQRYWGGNMDEGWTRLVLEQYGFPYQTLRDDEIKNTNLKERIDVLILPDDSTDMIIGDDTEDRLREHPVPLEYRSGIREEGIDAIKEFVQGGGTLVALNQACNFAIEKLDLPVQNILASKSAKDFYCPGSTLHANINTSHRLTYGMPDETLIFFWNGPTFRVKPSFSNEKCEILVQYPERDILQSGWLVGEEQIAGTAGMISVEYGKGSVILFGFRPQHRAQTHGTFKLFFNALIG
ncbi:peptidase M14 family protein [Candidatus Poribacteria bacterium]|nr:peptidase M14 family protein [Candidatus Poribacteria bacterium]